MPVTARCAVCSRAIRNKRRVSCTICEGVSYHIKCWKNKFNFAIAKDSIISNWRCNNCSTSTEPSGSNVTTDNIINAQALNELYTEEILRSEDTEEYCIPNDVRDRYFETSDLTFTADRLKSDNSKFFMTMSINIRSLNKYDNFCKIDALVHSMAIKPHVIGITETWLTTNEHGPHNNLSGYSFISNARTKSRGGGVGLYIKNNIKFSIRNDLTVMDEKIFESIFIDAYYANQKFTVGTIYSSQNATIDANNKFLSHLWPLLKKIEPSKVDCFIMGDTNHDLGDIENSIVDQFKDEMFGESFYSLINHPTRITTTSSTIIDHIWTNITNKNFLSGILVDKISDHLPIFQLTELEYFKDPVPSPHTHFSNQNLKHLKNALSHLDLSALTTTNDINQSFDHLHLILQTAIESLPKRQKRNTENKSWYDSDLEYLKTQKEKTYKKFKRTGKYRDKLIHNSAHIKYFATVAQKREKFIADRFSDLKDDIKGTWKFVNSLLGKNKTSPQITLNINNKNEVDPTSLANHFNAYFANVAETIRTTIPSAHVSFHHYLPQSTSNDKNSFFLFPTDIDEITEVIKKLKPKRSAGLDKIPTMILKYLPDNILQILMDLINRSFQEGIFPNIYKKSKIVPIYKNKGSRKSVEQYRPITLVNSLSKIIEKLVYKRLDSFLNKKNFFFNKQFGFRKKMSTSHAISLLVSTVTKNMNKKHKTLGIFLDLSRAFDLVDHDILLYKLNHYGIRGLANSWFRSYLSDRTQQVEINGELSSNICNIIFGTPQGSILAPLLFLIFINDLPNCLEHGVPLLFADDTNILISHTNCHELITKGNQELVNIQNYLGANKLFLNAGKTQAMFIRTNNTTIPTNLENLKIYDENVEIVNNLKFLGVIINEKLSWKSHMLFIKSKLRRNTAVCAKIKNYLNKDAFLNLYHSMIECHTRYGITSWCFGNSTQKLSLQRSCNRFLQMALKTFSTDHLHEEMERNKILSIDQLLLLEIGLNMFKIHNETFPSALTDFFTSTTRTRTLRSGRGLIGDIPRIQSTKQALGFKGPIIWSNIPNFVKYSSEEGSVLRQYNDFKNNLKSYILSIGISESKVIIDTLIHN